MDLSHGFHQITLHPDFCYISTFRTHEGQHQFKVLFFGVSPASELFHNKIKEALHRLPGYMTTYWFMERHWKNMKLTAAHALPESKPKASPSITANAHLVQHLSHGLATSSVPLVCQPIPLPAAHRQRTKSKASYKPASTMPNSCLTPTKHMHR